MNTQALQNQLIVDEGIRLKPYMDSVGVLTIGVGRNLSNVGISHEEALMLLQTDIVKVYEQLDGTIGWWRHMSDNRQQALANMCFNLGINGLLGFHDTLNHLHANEFDLAAKTMLNSKWAQQVGDRAARLSEMIKNG